MYKTILYGWEYDYDNKDNYYLKTLVTDESDGEIWFENVYDGKYGYDEFQHVDQKYYSRADREIIERIFEYRWRQ